MLFKAENLRAFRHKFWLVLAPALIWAILFLLRKYTIQPWCAVTPTPCTSDQVNAFDQWAFHFNNIQYDRYSTIIQDSMAVFVFLFPFLIYSTRSLARAFQEAWLMLQISLWNGVGLEVARAIVQRPRPLVFRSPMEDGLNIHQYTSFYSGHTSFVALASLGMYFMICRRFPNQKWIQINFFFLFLSLSVLTGALRVMGGRHYPTDVIAGFTIGCILCTFFNRPRKKIEN
jgi:membrane-associated phospholipid phosphatase